MKIQKRLLTILFGVLMIGAGAMHFIKAEKYVPFVPDIFPQLFVVYASGVVELLCGAVLFLPRLRSIGSKAILIMMILFLPLHVIDVFREHPAIGNHMAAMVRLPVQLLLIFLAWLLNRK